MLQSFAQAKDILITDIDDTLKLSMVRDRVQLILRGPRTGPEMVVDGMNEALWRIVYQYSIEDVFYVSKIPSILQGLHDKFLERNYFPPGLLFGRDSLNNFKETQIKSIIDLEKPDRVILIGDNGELDPQIYKRIVDSYIGKEIEFEVRIRIAYPDNYKLEDGQIGFYKGKDFFESFDMSPRRPDGFLIKVFRKIRKACRFSAKADI